MDRHEADRCAPWVLPLFLAGQMIGILIGRMADSPAAGWTALTLAVSALFFLRGCARLAAMTLLACALGVTTGWYAYHPHRPAEGDCVISGQVCDEMSPGRGGQVKTRLTHVTLDGAPAPGDAYWSFYPEELPPELAPGCTVTFLGRVYTPSGADNPDGFDFNAYLLGQRIVYAVYGDDGLTISHGTRSLSGGLASLRHRLMKRFCAVMGEEAGGYAGAMLLGAKQRIPVDDQDAFSRAGMAHVLVVSGFHVGVLARLLARMMRRRSLAVRTAVSCGVIAIYVVMVGAHAPVIRASILFLLGQLGRLAHRRRSMLWTLSACASLTLLLAPAQLTSASFQLTYAAVLGMAVISPWIPWRPVRYTLGAQLGVMMPVLYYFQELQLMGLAANLLLLPAASALIGLYWLVLIALPVPFAAEILGSLAGACTRLLTSAVELLSAVPGASIWTSQSNLLTLLGWVGIMAVCSPLIRIGNRCRAALACMLTVMMLVTVIPLPHTATEYIQFSDGNADAALLWDEDRVVVIDAGEDGRSLSGYLRSNRLSVDTLVITHLHEDHAGGIRALIDDRIPVREIILPWGAETVAVAPEVTPLIEELAAAGTLIRHAARGDIIDLPSGNLTALWPEAGKVRPGSDANGNSLVLLAEVEGVTMLLTGDMPGLRSGYVAVDADILKAAHHGAADDTTADFLAVVSPSAILVSCGRSADLTELRQRAHAPVYATNERGAVIIRLKNGEYTMETIKE